MPGTHALLDVLGRKIRKLSLPSALEQIPGPLFHHRPLAHREFRLLDILPLEASHNDALQCTIKHVSFDQTEPLDYEAISYFWGDPTPSASIQIGGINYNLPVNSEKALRRMAYSDRTRTVYIDSACIDQSDKTERENQVLLMGDIYRHAQATLVYLGEEDSTTARAFADIQLLYREVVTDLGPDRDLAELTGLGRGKIVYAEHDIRSHFDAQALGRFFGRPWFERVWIVQEVSVATTCRLICGSQEIGLDIVLEVAAWFYNYHHLHIASELRERFSKADTIWRARYLLARDGGLAIHEILDYGQNLEASNPRDKIYGMFGLLNHAKLVKPLIPDYTKPIPHVFRDAVRQSFAFAKEPLWVLQLVSHREERDLLESGFPSWVPALDTSWDSDLDTAWFEVHGDREPFGDRQLAIQAAYAGDEEPDVLELQGLELCHIVELLSAFNHVEWQECTQLEAIASWCSKALDMLLRHGIPQAKFGRIAIADTNVSTQGSSKRDYQGLTALLQHQQDDTPLPTVEELTQNQDNSTRRASQFRLAMINACDHRQFAIMSNGTAGLVPKLAQLSDSVVMMHGGWVPCVLRPQNEYCVFLGECYLDGWMSGQEHSEELKQRMGDEPPKRFRIR